MRVQTVCWASLFLFALAISWMPSQERWIIWAEFMPALENSQGRSRYVFLYTYIYLNFSSENAYNKKKHRINIKTLQKTPWHGLAHVCLCFVESPRNLLDSIPWLDQVQIEWGTCWRHVMRGAENLTWRLKHLSYKPSIRTTHTCKPIWILISRDSEISWLIFLK